MRQVEVKFRLTEQQAEEARGRLGDLGAEYLGKVFQEDSYFDKPDKTLLKTGGALRLRRHSDGVLLTLKRGQIFGREIRSGDEVETEVGDFDKAREIIEGLGFSLVQVVRKERESWELRDVRIELDYVVDKRERWLELEVSENGRADLERVIEAIGLVDAERETRHYGHIYKEDIR